MKKKWSTPEIREIFVENNIVKGISGIRENETEKFIKVKAIIEKMLNKVV